jgi:pyrimidine operon attenuation protein/uracil phosphoribosyltransferase
MSKAKGKGKKKAAPPGKKRQKLVHSAAWIREHIAAFIDEIARQDVLDHALICGIRSRGAELAHRVREGVNKKAKVNVPYGALDITLYRDDVALRGPKFTTQKRGTEIDVSIDNRVVFLVDDVICTGRTIRAALDELTDLGRPGAVRLYSLIDRGGRELPIQPDRVGERMTLPFADRIDVRLKETDGEEGVYITLGGML